ncbi:hypothetical protein OQA88_8885 [Cercophora sp. LCS_1]
MSGSREDPILNAFRDRRRGRPASQNIPLRNAPSANRQETSWSRRWLNDDEADRLSTLSGTTARSGATPLAADRHASSRRGAPDVSIPYPSFGPRDPPSYDERPPRPSPPSSPSPPSPPSPPSISPPSSAPPPGPPSQNGSGSGQFRNRRYVEDEISLGLDETDTGPQEARVMLGLDYGLAVIHETMERDASFSDVHVFNDWAGTGGDSGPPKIPSAISYSMTPSRCKQWGDDIDKSSRVLQWTKLELQPQSSLQELTRLRNALAGLSLLKTLQNAARTNSAVDVPRHITRSSFNVVQDYLSRIAKCYYLNMRKTNAFAIGTGNIPVDMVITHPVEWKYEALNKTYRAVTGAFSKKMFPTRRNIYLVPEPEACAVFTVQDMLNNSGSNTLIPGDCFVVCDAGGGTVDLVTYCLEEVEPLKLSKVGYISGAHCGATFIDRAFINWFESKITNANIRSHKTGADGQLVLDTRGTTILNRFERFKRQFTGAETNTLTLPSGFQVVAGFPQYADGLLTITAEDMKTFFSFSVNKTLELIEGQVTSAEVMGHTVSHIFMSGGMSQSQYLFDRVSDWAETYHARMEVARPREGWTAVVQGAVLCGMGIGANNAVLVKSCPWHIGLVGCVKPNARLQRRGVPDEVHGGLIADKQVKWLIQKGDVMLPDAPIKTSHTISCTFRSEQLENESIMEMTVWATEVENAPTQGFKPKPEDRVGVIQFPLRRIPRVARRSRTTDSGAEYRKAHMEVRLSVEGDGEIIVKVRCEGTELADFSFTESEQNQGEEQAQGR